MKVENELGVIVRFAEMCADPEFKWEIDSISGFFPDAIIIAKGTDDSFTVEFEFKASSFVTHHHDLTKCDVIICWQNDWPDCPINVWSLSFDDKFLIWPKSAIKIADYQRDVELRQLRERVAYLERVLDDAHITIGADSLPLTVNEHRLMCLFLDNIGEVCDRDMLTRAVWGHAYAIDADAKIEQLVSRLRSKLADTGYSGTIQTQRGFGYIFTEEAQ
jgi:hypothetical protein